MADPIGNYSNPPQGVYQAGSGGAGTSGAGGITQLTGDGTAGPGSGSQPLTLATVNADDGTHGDAETVPQVTVNGKGLITAVTDVAIEIAIAAVTGLQTALDGIPAAANPTATVSGSAVNGSADTFMRSDAAPALANTAVTPATYGDATHVAQFTVDQQGRITSATDVAITGSSNVICVAIGDNTPAGAGGAVVAANSSRVLGPGVYAIEVDGYHQTSGTGIAMQMSMNHNGASSSGWFSMQTIFTSSTASQTGAITTSLGTGSGQTTTGPGTTNRPFRFVGQLTVVNSGTFTITYMRGTGSGDATLVTAILKIITQS